MVWTEELLESVAKSTERSFSDLFKEVDEYLDLTYRHLPQELKDRVNVMTEAQMVKYKSIPIVNRDDLVEVLGCELKCLDVDSPFCSDFVIDSDFQWMERNRWCFLLISSENR